MDTASTISVIIPVYNGGHSFRQCLSSIESSLREPDELIVVSDGDTDGSWQVAKEFGAQVIRLSVQSGPAKARNEGAKAAKGDILFFVDADVALHPNTIGLVERQFQERPGLMALIGSYDDAPGAINFLSQYKNLFHHYTHQISSEAASTFWGACGAMQRSAFFAVGGFDESWRNCIEDIELGYRFRRAGYSIHLCKEIQVKHLKRWEPLSLLRAEIFYRAIPWTKLLLRDRQFNSDLNLSNHSRFSVVLVYGLILSLLVSLIYPQLLLASLILAASLFVINIDVYRFFLKKRGLLFTLQVVPWHWFYFLYGGAAFAYGTVSYYLSTEKPLNPSKPSRVVKVEK